MRLRIRFSIRTFAIIVMLVWAYFGAWKATVSRRISGCAGVRQGTSPYCPTCYADCGKRATTGADGRFTISGLDPTPIFQSLIMADGHRPQFIKKVDPQQETSVVAKLAPWPGRSTLALALAIVALGSAATAVRRLARIGRALRKDTP